MQAEGKVNSLSQFQVTGEAGAENSQEWRAPIQKRRTIGRKQLFSLPRECQPRAPGTDRIAVLSKCEIPSLYHLSPGGLAAGLRLLDTNCPNHKARTIHSNCSL